MTKIAYYQNPVQVWDADKCKKMVRRVLKDGMGTPYPFKEATLQAEAYDATVRYNGGCIRNGEWYVGESFDLPILAPGYMWEKVPTWCWRIRESPTTAE